MGNFDHLAQGKGLSLDFDHARQNTARELRLDSCILLKMRLLNTRYVALVLAFSLAGYAVSETNPTILESELRAHLGFLASDELEGRGTPSRGFDVATKYVESQLKIFGLEPMGENGSYFQRIELVQPKFVPESCSIKLLGKDLQWGEGFLGDPQVKASGKASGQLVYVGSGWKTASLNPYEGVNVKGKILVTVRGASAQKPSKDSEFGPMQACKELGAVGVIEIPSINDVSSWQARMNSAVRAGRQRVAKFEAETPAYPVAVLSESSAKELIGTTKNSFVDMQNGNIASFEFAPEATADLTMSVDRQSAYIANVLGMVPGSDPKLKSEYVFVGAHLDHLGISARATGDNIYNGADDDGSGSASILAMARAISQGPMLKRSVVFIWHAAEEAGLLGSRYFNQYPTVPQKDITAMINIDMIGRSRAVGDTKAANEKLTTASEIYVVGSNKLSSELKPIVDAADQRDKTLAFNYEYDKPNDPERLYYRSDHYNYAVKGIPVIFFFDGVHEDYHRVTDEIAKIDFDKMRRVGNNVLQLLTTFANRKVRMKVDLPLDQAK